MPETLYSIIPDPDVVLRLAPADLAPYLLRLARQYLQPDKFTPGTVPTSGPGIGMGAPQQGYPPNRLAEIDIAVNEGWQWLRLHFLIVPEPGINGEYGWYRLTRQAQQLVDDTKFADFRRAATFPKELLHPSIADQVWLDLARGELEDAVFHAFRAVEIAVREACGYPTTAVGVAMVGDAFNPDKGPLTDPKQDAAERLALSALFAGAIGSYKNPHSHRTATIQETSEAQEIVMLASHLLRIVDDRYARFVAKKGA